MSDFSELKKLAEAATPGPWSMCGEADGSEGFEIIQDIWNERGTHTGKDVVVYEWSDESDPLGVINRKDAEFIAAANPAAVLALIAENQAMAGLLKQFVDGEHDQDENQAERHMYFTEAQSLLALVNGEIEGHTIVPDLAIKAIRDERDQLRAEIAGLRTGFKAYEQVVQGLKAENEALRNAALSKAVVWCACGDGHPANSYGAGFMDANGGVCANCDAAQPKVSCPLELFEGLRDSASEEAEQHRQCMGSYRPHRQEVLDAVVRQCDALISGVSKEAQS